MNTDTDADAKLLKDTIISLSQLGATYVKCDGIDIFFTISKHSELTRDCEQLKNIRDFIMGQFGYKLRVAFLKK